MAGGWFMELAARQAAERAGSEGGSGTRLPPPAQLELRLPRATADNLLKVGKDGWTDACTDRPPW